MSRWLAITLGVLALVAGPGCTRNNPWYEPDLSEDARLPDGGEPGSPDLGQAVEQPTLRFTLTQRNPGPVREDEPFELVLTAVDRDGRPTPSYSGTLLLRSTWGDVTPSVVAIESLNAQGELGLAVKLNREGTARVTAADRELVGETLPIVVTPGHWQAGPAPVLQAGEPQAWDGLEVNMAEVRALDEQLVLLYRGRPGRSGASLGGLGRATSTDLGATWTTDPSNPLLTDQYRAAQDFLNLSAPSFLVSPHSWTVWYTVTPPGRTYIARGTSADGLAWEADPRTPVLAARTVGSAVELEVRDPCVILQENGEFQMWYTIVLPAGQAIGLATSQDGITWEPFEYNPVFRPEPTGWDAVSVSQPAVIRDGSVYRMWYTGASTLEDSATAPAALGYATSHDGINWTRSSSNPILAPSGQDRTFDRYRLGHPTVVRQGEPILFFAGFDGERWSIGRAFRF